MTIAPLRLALFVLLSGLAAYVLFDYVADQRDSARRERDSAQAEARDLRESARISSEMLAARDQIDQKHTEVLNIALTQNDALRRAVADGDQRLRIRATCSTAMPNTTGAAGVADAIGAELAADARPDYFTLRDQLALSLQMILGLQDYIRQVIQRSPATASPLNPLETPK